MHLLALLLFNLLWRSQMISGAEQSKSSKTGTILRKNDNETSVPTEEDRKRLIYDVAVGRRDVDPSATNMMFMNYSDEMEKLAMEWVGNCTEPNTTSLHHPQRADVGVYTLSYSKNQAPQFYDIASTTIDLCSGYNYTSNNCTLLTAYYLQIVWANTSQFGCAMKDCSIKRPNSTTKTFYMTCVFKPGGRVGDERPYKNGTPCTACPSGYGCYMNQCVNHTSELQTTTSSSSLPPTRNFVILHSCALFVFCYNVASSYYNPFEF
uniref:SCP domain-containing protein n=2 Tax=Mesocestoides corti TaxID=53468 RepID=A0A5K3F6G8_MESCO